MYVVITSLVYPVTLQRNLKRFSLQFSLQEEEEREEEKCLPEDVQQSYFIITNINYDLSFTGKLLTETQCYHNKILRDYIQYFKPNKKTQWIFLDAFHGLFIVDEMVALFKKRKISTFYIYLQPEISNVLFKLKNKLKA